MESYGSTPLFLPVRPDGPYWPLPKKTGLRIQEMMYRINNNPGEERVEDGRDALLKYSATPPGILHLV